MLVCESWRIGAGNARQSSQAQILYSRVLCPASVRSGYVQECNITQCNEHTSTSEVIEETPCTPCLLRFEDWDNLRRPSFSPSLSHGLLEFIYGHVAFVCGASQLKAHIREHTVLRHFVCLKRCSCCRGSGNRWRIRAGQPLQEAPRRALIMAFCASTAQADTGSASRTHSCVSLTVVHLFGS